MRRGEGTEIWHGMDLLLGRPVTIRMPWADLPGDERIAEEALERFQREARAAVELVHPGVAPVYDVGQYEGRPYAVLEPSGGRDLESVLEEAPGGLPIGTALDYGIQVADALAAAHSEGLAHGGVGPGCLLLSDDGIVQICDFGLAALQRPQAVDESADLYALGATLFRLLTGRDAASTGGPPSARVLRAGILPELDDCLRALLAREPGRGGARAAEVAASLRRLVPPYQDRYRLRLLAEAERLAWTIPSWHQRLPVLRGIVEVLAGRHPEEAERLARSVPPPHFQASLLLEITRAQAEKDPNRARRLLTDIEALAYTVSDPVFSRDGILQDLVKTLAGQDFAGAERLARGISEPYARAGALRDIAMALAATRPDRARRVLLDAADLVWTISETSSRIGMACLLAGALAGQDPDRGRGLLTDAEHLARADGSVLGGGWDGERAPQPGWLARIVEALAPQDPVAAERLARTIDEPSVRDLALVSVVEALARRDPRAAERLARGIGHPSTRDVALGGIVKAIADRDPAEAERIVQGMPDPAFKATPWADLVGALAKRDPSEAERVARGIPDREARAWRLRDVAAALGDRDPARARDLLVEAADLSSSPEIVAALARLDPASAERLARGVADPDQRARALRDVASALVPHDAVHARDLLDESAGLARELTHPYGRATALRETVQILAELDPPAAERLARTIADPVQHATALLDVAALLSGWDAPLVQAPG